MAGWFPENRPAICVCQSILFYLFGKIFQDKKPKTFDWQYKFFTSSVMMIHLDWLPVITIIRPDTGFICSRLMERYSRNVLKRIRVFIKERR